MRIIPAVDLKDGIVVHAVAGRRAEYRPLTSVLAANPQPATVARGLIHRLGLSEFYVADLDAIAGSGPDWASYDALMRAGGSLWIDAGITDLQRAEVLAKFAGQHRAVTGVVIGLESLADAGDLDTICRIIGPQRCIFSLDLWEGSPRARAMQWQGLRPLNIAADVVAAGIRRLIILDVTAVGMNQGCPTLDLCRELSRCNPDVHLISGGGIGSTEDLVRADNAGCDAVLVSTALHNSRMELDGLAQLPGAAKGEVTPNDVRSSRESNTRTSFEPK